MRKRITEMICLEGMVETISIFNEIFPEGSVIPSIEAQSEQITYDEQFELKGIIQSIGYKEFVPFFLHYRKLVKSDEE